MVPMVVVIDLAVVVMELVVVQWRQTRVAPVPVTCTLAHGEVAVVDEPHN